jgi:hypothetical protein
MNLSKGGLMLLVPEEEINYLKSTQEKILQELQVIRQSKVETKSMNSTHVTAKEFMSAVRICRSKFDKLANSNQIRTIKKQRKIYVPFTEIARYFSDSTIG